jgi:hypothetical protein
MDKIRSYPTSVPVENRSNKLRKAWITGTALIVLLITLVALNARAAATQTLAGSQDKTQSFALAYDATGAMLDAVVFSHQVQPAFSGLAYDATGAMLAAVVYPTYSDQQWAVPISQGLAYDATGAMQDAVVFSHQVQSAFSGLAYDATGAMLAAVVFPAYSDQQVTVPTSPASAYDATGAMLNAVVFSHQVRPVSYPLWYDATGAMLEAVVFPKYPE